MTGRAGGWRVRPVVVRVVSLLCTLALLVSYATPVHAPTEPHAAVAQRAVWTPRPITKSTATATVTVDAIETPIRTVSATPMDSPTPAITVAQATVTISPAQHDAVELILNSMTLEQKAGQVMMPVVGDSAQLTPDMQSRVAEMHLGGVVLREKNVASIASLSALVNQLQVVARANGAPGLLIGMDQEGGQVSRLRQAKGFTEFPSPMALTATPGGCENARAVAEAMGAEMRALGINTNLAPVLDVNNNPENPVIGVRSFSSDPRLVSRCGVAEVEGFAGQGIIAVGKHFPGHGDTAIDSHTGLPLVSHSRERLAQLEFMPFQAAITAGIPAIMSAHIVFPALDDTPNLPVTLSPRVLTGLLREEWRFGGLIFSDAMTMGALAEAKYPTPIAAVTALKAGVDVLLFGEGGQIQRDAHAAIVAAVNAGNLTYERLDEAVRRVLTMKAQYGLLEPAPIDPVVAATQVGGAEHRALARRIAEQSITLVKDNAGRLPLKPGARVLLVENDYTRSSSVGIEIEAERLLVGLEPTQAEINRALAASVDRLVIVTTANVHKKPERPELVRALLKAGRQVIVVALAAPYDLLYFPDVPTYIAIYGVSPDTMVALNDVLAGRLQPVGRLPVELPGLYPLGYRVPNSQTQGSILCCAS